MTTITYTHKEFQSLQKWNEILSLTQEFDQINGNTNGVDSIQDFKPQITYPIIKSKEVQIDYEFVTFDGLQWTETHKGTITDSDVSCDLFEMVEWIHQEECGEDPLDQWKVTITTKD